MIVEVEYYPGDEARKQVTPYGGGFRKCVAQVEAHTPMRGRTARGYCANRIH